MADFKSHRTRKYAVAVQHKRADHGRLIRKPHHKHNWYEWSRMLGDRFQRDPVYVTPDELDEAEEVDAMPADELMPTAEPELSEAEQLALALEMSRRQYEEEVMIREALGTPQKEAPLEQLVVGEIRTRRDGAEYTVIPAASNVIVLEEEPAQVQPYEDWEVIEEGDFADTLDTTRPVLYADALAKR